MKKWQWLALLLTAIISIAIFPGAITLINLATQVTGVLPIANGGTGTATASVTEGFATTSNTVINPAATTDTELAEFALPAGYLNTANKSLTIFAKVVQSTGTSQTPTVTYRIKLCTVSGCGSGTVLTMLAFGNGGTMTASTTEFSEITGHIATVTAGSSGTLETAGFALINTSSINKNAIGGSMVNDNVTAVSSTIDLTAALFLDVTGQFSTQSGTKNGMVARLVTAKPVN